jgi:hypothetical protein
MPTLVRGYDEALLLRKENVMKHEELVLFGKYRVESFGSGWAYGITCLNTGKTLWVQDEFVGRFEQMLDFADLEMFEIYFNNHPRTEEAVADYA